MYQVPFLITPEKKYLSPFLGELVRGEMVVTLERNVQFLGYGL
jgi:hypothetical protein